VNILIIGGSGFIGSEIARYAISKGDDVTIWDLKPNHTLKVLRRDIRDRTVIEADLSNFDLVMVLAAVTSQLEFEIRPIDSFDTNVKGLHNVLEACRRSKVSKVMFASSSSIYGNVRKRMSERDPSRPNNMYGTSKAIGEHLVNAYGSAGCFDELVVRFFNTFGAGEADKGAYKSIISIFLEQIISESRVVVYGDGEQRRDFIDVRDAARITYELAVNATGTFNVGTGRSISWNQILNRMKAMGLKFSEKRSTNPFKDYQYFTEADTKKIISLGLRPQIKVEQGIDELIARSAHNLVQISS
jgi:nucleoside-diphosphate-sugar epimerase